MKIFSLLLTIVMLVWSWNIVHSIPDQKHDNHSILQAEIKNRIRSTILKKHPQAQNLNFEKLWTEARGENKILASFRYSFDLNMDKKTIAGTATLKNLGTPTSPRWKMNVKLDRDHVEFSEDLIIAPGQR